MRHFNLRQYKQAWSNGDPQAFLPGPWKPDPYDRTRNPGDGQGHKVTTPGSQGLPGENPDMSAPEFGRKWTTEGPDIPSAMDHNLKEDKTINRNNTPSDGDPDDPFAAESRGDNRSTQYGTGLSTDFGQGLHDDKEPSADSVLGLNSTVGRMISKEDRDRPTPFGNMQKSNNPYNASSRRSIYDRIRNN